ncbi:tRNA pseudouridine synthase B [bioreactor metagenome]|uniref:tRNA pseudouridine(55) synthase n=1 Tax=bioreactor metagenome TaxID=1076179 RepID=A0A645DNL6_9ZZZZ
MYSAVKINGKKLYEYARQDKIIERQTREIEIFDLVLINHTQTELEGVVRCSKGTYIRTLCEDIAAQLNGLATMSYLQRTAIGKLTIDQAYSLEDIESGAYQLLTPKEVLTDYPFIEYANIEDVYNGKPIRLDLDSELVCIEHEHELVAVYEKDKGHIYRCSRGLW